MNDFYDYGYSYTSINEEEILAVVAVFFTVLGIALLVGLVIWLLGAIGIFRMSKSIGLKYPRLSFIYPVYPFALGRVAEKYVKKDGKKSAKFSGWLLGLGIAEYVLNFAFFAIAIFAVYKIGINAINAIESDISMSPDMFGIMIPAIILYFIAFAVSIAYMVLYYIAFWRICSIFCYKNATLFLVLSIVLTNLLSPIFIFAIRNKQPKFTFNERMGIEEIPRQTERISEE